MNMYAYVHNDPINGTDPSGLAGDEPPIQEVTVIGQRLRKPFCPEGASCISNASISMGPMPGGVGMWDGFQNRDGRETNNTTVIVRASKKTYKIWLFGCKEDDIPCQQKHFNQLDLEIDRKNWWVVIPVIAPFALYLLPESLALEGAEGAAAAKCCFVAGTLAEAINGAVLGDAHSDAQGHITFPDGTEMWFYARQSPLAIRGSPRQNSIKSFEDYMNINEYIKGVPSDRPTFVCSREILIPPPGNKEYASHFADIIECDEFAISYIGKIDAFASTIVYSKSIDWGSIVRVFYVNKDDPNQTGTIICWKSEGGTLKFSVDSYP